MSDTITTPDAVAPSDLISDLHNGHRHVMSNHNVSRNGEAEWSVTVWVDDEIKVDLVEAFLEGAGYETEVTAEWNDTWRVKGTAEVTDD